MMGSAWEWKSKGLFWNSTAGSSLQQPSAAESQETSKCGLQELALSFTSCTHTQFVTFVASGERETPSEPSYLVQYLTKQGTARLLTALSAGDGTYQQLRSSWVCYWASQSQSLIIRGEGVGRRSFGLGLTLKYFFELSERKTSPHGTDNSKWSGSLPFYSVLLIISQQGSREKGGTKPMLIYRGEKEKGKIKEIEVAQPTYLCLRLSSLDTSSSDWVSNSISWCPCRGAG